MDSKERARLENIFLEGQQLALQLNVLMQQHANEPTVPVPHAMPSKLSDCLRLTAGFAMGSLPYSPPPITESPSSSI